MLSASRAWAILLVQVLLFYGPVLFVRSATIPWDFRYYHYPLAATMADAFAHGEFPLWTPYIYCGMPFYAMLGAQPLYPPTLLAVLLSNLAGGRHLLFFMELQLVAHVFLAGLFTWRLLRALNLGPAAALTGATIYQLGAFFATQAQHVGAVHAAAWMPLAWEAVILLARGFTFRRLAMLAAALAMSFLAGFPAVTAVVWGSALLLALALRPRAAAYAALAAAWAAALAAVQLLPTLELTGLSVASRRSRFMGTGGGMPLEAFVSLVWPNRWGVFDFDPLTWRLPWNVTFLYLYCGLPALVFAAAALWRRAKREALLFAALTAVFALWMLGDKTPAGRLLFPLLPRTLRGALYVEFALCGFTLALAVLAAFGAERLLARRRPAIQAAVVALVALDLILVSSGRPMNTASKRREPAVTREQIDGFREPAEALRKLTHATTPPARYDSVNGPELWTEGAPLLDVQTASGDDPFALLRYLDVRALFAPGDAWTRYWQVSRPNSALLDMLNVKYLLAREPLPEPGRHLRVADFPGMIIYRNPAVLPRFYLAGRARRASSATEALALVADPSFDPRREAIVEGAVEAAATGRVAVLSYAPREIALETEAAGPALLVTSEAWYPGWRAWIDDRPAPLVPANAAFRGLAIPAGRHRVRMLFDPPLLWLGGAISLLALAALLTVLARKRQRPLPDPRPPSPGPPPSPAQREIIRRAWISSSS